MSKQDLKKVLLMGKSGAGKTSMRSIIFANYVARDTTRLGATIDVEHSHVRFLGNLVLNLWDCGGQEAFMDSYFETQRDHIFRNVALLIYVFDIESADYAADVRYYKSCIEAIEQNSPHAKVFCLIHKMDLIADELREQALTERSDQVKSLCENVDVRCFGTSIWDETLYRAWSQIVYALIPNVQVLEKQIKQFAEVTCADEVVLFERATFLVIAHVSIKEHGDAHRFEKISNIVKQFKLSCGKVQSQFQSMEVRNSNFTAFVDQFTANTAVMIVQSDPIIQPSATALNIKLARAHFEDLIRHTAGVPQ